MANRRTTGATAAAQCVLCGRTAGWLLDGVFVAEPHTPRPRSRGGALRCGACGGNLLLAPDETVTPASLAVVRGPGAVGSARMLFEVVPGDGTLRPALSARARAMRLETVADAKRAVLKQAATWWGASLYHCPVCGGDFARDWQAAQHLVEQQHPVLRWDARGCWEPSPPTTRPVPLAASA